MKSKKWLGLIMSGLLAAAPLVYPHSEAQAYGKFQDYHGKQAEAGGIIVKMKAGAKLERASVSNKSEISDETFDSRLGLKHIKLKNPEKLEAVIDELNANPDIEYAEPNYVYHAFDLPDASINVAYNDTYYSYQWGIPAIKANQAVDLVTASQRASKIIAIVDTGVSLTHEDLQGSILAGYDFVNGDSSPNDDNGHGTHVAGIAAAIGNNAKGVAGVASGAKILPVKVLDSEGSGYTTDIVNGMRYAADNGAKVLNLSLGANTSCSRTYQDAINYVRSKGAVVVVASGNSNTAVASPANCTGTVSVGSVNSSLVRSSFSNYGSVLDVVAPGESIASTYPNNQYANMSGTSMASPHVAGVAALILAANSSLTPDQVETILKQTATDLGAAGRDNYYGSGLVNALAAVQAALQ